MSALAFTVTREFRVLECGECGQSFAVTENWYIRNREKNPGFYCPNGHLRIWTEGEVAKLKKELEQEKKRREWAEGSEKRAREYANKKERSAAAYRGACTRLRKRVGHGVCPCCKRNFGNLKKHMEMKHPKFGKKNVEKVPV